MKVIKFKLKLPGYKDLLRYGEIVYDREFTDGVRAREIKYMGILYHLRMKDGEVLSLKQWDSFPYTEDEADIASMGDDELADMLMFSDRDRKTNSKAENVYWLCIKEINKRLDDHGKD